MSSSASTIASPCKSTSLKQTSLHEAELSLAGGSHTLPADRPRPAPLSISFNELPCKLVTELLESGDDIGLAKEMVGEICIHLRNGKQK